MDWCVTNAQPMATRSCRAFSDGKADLAVVRGDVGELSKAQAVVVVSHMAALVIAPPGSSIDSMDKPKGHRVGVLGGEANTKIVDVLSKEYGLDRAKVFKDRSARCPPGHSIQGGERDAHRDPSDR
jgi:hypothetical protein